MTVFESLYGWVSSKDGADACFKKKFSKTHHAVTKYAWTPPSMDAQHYSMLNSVMYLKYKWISIVTYSYTPKRIYIGNQGPWYCSILSAEIKLLNSGEFPDSRCLEYHAMKYKKSMHALWQHLYTPSHSSTSKHKYNSAVCHKVILHAAACIDFLYFIARYSRHLGSGNSPEFSSLISALRMLQYHG